MTQCILHMYITVCTDTEGEEGGHTGSDKDTVTPSLPSTLNEVSVCDEDEEEESERVASNTPPTQPTQKRKVCFIQWNFSLTKMSCLCTYILYH